MMRPGRVERRRSRWGMVVAAFLVLIMSGSPTFARELLGDGEVPRAMDCEGSDGDNHCPPNCLYGACAKVIQGVPAVRLFPKRTAFESHERVPIVLDEVVPRDSVNESESVPKRFRYCAIWRAIDERRKTSRSRCS